MNSPTPPACRLMTDPATLSTFQYMFCQAIGHAKPIAIPDNLPHLATHDTQVPGSMRRVLAQPAWLSGGYCYGVHSAPLDQTRLDAEVTRARETGCRHLLIPSVRTTADTSYLRTRSMMPFGTATESIVSLPDSLDVGLRRNMGRKEFQNVRRAVQRAEAAYSLSWYGAGDVRNCAARFAEWAMVFEAHESRYGNATVMYSHDVLTAFLGSATMAPLLRIGLRIDPHTDRLVQGMLTLLDPQEGILYYLAQAIDRSIVPAQQNLYRASYYHVYELAQSLGAAIVHLGRGNVEAKLRLGATQCIPQQHWIGTI